MTITLGISNNICSGVALVVDGNVISAVSEERFVGVKDYKGIPHQAINWTLQNYGLELGEIETVSYGWSNGFDAEKHLALYLRRASEISLLDGDPALHIFQHRVAEEIKRDKVTRGEIYNWMQKVGAWSKLKSIDHHEAHALGAFLTSNYEDALVISCDGRGDFQSLTVTSVKGGTADVLYRASSSDSLGYFYGRITKALGFQPDRHEGKVLGLAAHGRPTAAVALMQEMITYEHGALRAKLGDLFQPFYDTSIDRLIAALSPFSKEDVAFAAQTHIEHLLCKLASHYMQAAGHSNLCLTGGVFSNVKINQRLSDLPVVKSCYVLPCMGDVGLPLASAIVADAPTLSSRYDLRGMLLGPPPTFDFDLDKASTVGCSLEAISTEEAASRVARDLVGRKVVGVVRGRAEFGPRALGNRSILSRADIEGIDSSLNRRLKRSEFMPFAPCILAEVSARYMFVDNDRLGEGWCMTRTFSCRKELMDSCPGLVHVDETARPQIVDRDKHSWLWKVLNCAWEDGGVPALINTSFNVHEHPIVQNISTAIECLVQGVVDVLYIDDKYRLVKAGYYDID